jgi:methionine-rich copper-binding protein CopC
MAMFKRAAGLAMALAALASFETPAFAHAHLITSNPAANSSAADVKEIKLVFSEGVILKFSGIDLKDETGKTVTTGAASNDPNSKKELIVPVTVKLAPGIYTVEWHVVSEDTHRVKGKFTFKVTQ